MLRTINLTKIVPIRPIQYGVGLFKAPIKEETEDKIQDEHKQPTLNPQKEQFSDINIKIDQYNINVYDGERLITTFTIEHILKYVSQNPALLFLRLVLLRARSYIQ